MYIFAALSMRPAETALHQMKALHANSPMNAALDADSAASGVLPFLVLVDRGLITRAAL
jgi:hypothetical protein